MREVDDSTTIPLSIMLPYFRFGALVNVGSSPLTTVNLFGRAVVGSDCNPISG